MADFTIDESDIVDLTLEHREDSNRRTLCELNMWLSSSNEIAIEYLENKDPLVISIDFNHIYVEFHDSEGEYHKVKLI